MTKLLLIYLWTMTKKIKFNIRMLQLIMILVLGFMMSLI